MSMPREIWAGTYEDKERGWCASEDLRRTNKEFLGGDDYILKSEHDALQDKLDVARKALKMIANKEAPQEVCVLTRQHCIDAAQEALAQIGEGCTESRF